LVALCALPLALHRRKEAWTLVAASVALWVLHVARLGDWMPLFRFYVPVLPLFGVLAQAGVVEVREVLKRVRLDPLGLRLFLVLLASAVVWSTVCRLYTYRNVERYGTDLYIEVGEELRRRARPEDTLAVIDAGAIPYFSELPTIDILGLTDAHIAHVPHEYYEFDRPIFGHEFGAFLRYDGDYVLDQRPTFIELPTGGEVMSGGKVLSTRGEVYLLMDEPKFQQDYAPLFERGHLTVFVRKDKDRSAR